MNPEDKITHAIVINQIALNNNEELKHTNFYKQGFKMRLNAFLDVLLKCEPDYDNFFNVKENETSEVYDVYERYTKAISSVPIWDCENITIIIEAYKKDPKSIQGICNKILK
jgi:hypothetical protein